MPHFLYKLFACIIFMCTFATATEKKGNRRQGDKIQGIPCDSANTLSTTSLVN